MWKRLFFLSLVVLIVGLALPKGILGATVDIRITKGADDVEERIGSNNGAMDITSSDLEFPYEDPGKVDPQILGLRFVNIPLPQGAVITNAYVEFEVDETKSGTLPANVIIDGELSPNAAPFTSARNNVSQRSPTAAVVPWSIENWIAEHAKSQTPNIASVIQEIVSQQGWAYGNALVLVMTDDPANPSTGVRCAEAYEGEAANAPLLHIEAVVKGAFGPTPANGATEVDTAMLEWLGEGASVTYKVYLSADPNVTDADLIGETPMNLQVVTLTPGTTYYWRVDQIEVGGTVNPGTVWSFTTLPVEAHFPSPADAATGVAVDAKLGWVPGKGAILHDMYFGMDQAAVAAGDTSTFKGKLMSPSFDPNLLASFTTYYWKVDEFAGPVTNAGPVWSFSTVDYYVIVNNQMTLNYNNTAAPFYSELVVDTPADLTFDGVANLTLRFKGATANSVEPLYVMLEDSAGASAVVTHPDAAATQIGQWWKWKIPLAAFSNAGVNLKAAAKLHIGVGNRVNPTAGTSGTILIDDVLVIKPVLILEPADVTTPGDNVKGVPNDGDWPAAETPPLVIDNNVNTKFLHYKGDIQTSGIQVSPSAGASVVTGLTFTTANDTAGRDPIAFELYGSNVSIDGPYELIATGPIVDFNQPVEWPRFTKNTTPISFTNSVEYEHYQVLFPAIRGPVGGSVNSMQIAEIELIGTVGVVPPLISAVVRANGQTGNRAPIGTYDGSTAPLATEPGGLKEGNLVFSDRTFTWASVPAEYVGAQYIRTFNSDKSTSELDVTYTVTISRPAIVWITADDRIPADWNYKGAVVTQQDAVNLATVAFAAPGTFADTGINLVIRESATTTRPMSVYAAQLPAGTYVFGIQPSDKDFYTIGAIE